MNEEEFYQRGLLLEKQRKWDQAWQIYLQLHQRNASNIRYIKSLGNLLYRNANYEEAKKYFLLGTAKTQNDLDLNYRTAMTLYKLEDKECIPLFEQLYKSANSANEAAVHTVRLQLAKAYLLDERIKESETLIEKCLSTDPNDARVLSILGQINLKYKNHERAYELFKKCTELAPKDYKVLLNLSTICRINENFDEAEENIAKAEKLEPNQPDIIVEKALIWYKTKSAHHSLAYLKRCHEQQPQDKKILKNIITIYRQIGSHRSTLQYSYVYLELDNQNAQILANIANSYNALGNPMDAIEFFKKAIAIDEKPEYILGLCSAYDTLKDNASNKKWLDRLYHIDPENKSGIYSRLFRKMYLCDWSSRKEDELLLLNTLERQIADNDNASSLPLLYFNYFKISGELHLRFNKFRSEHFKEKIKPFSSSLVHSKEFQKKEKIRIGYISPDFKDHPVGRLVSTLFEHHDRKRFEIYGYSLISFQSNDKYAVKIKSSVDVFRELAFEPFIEGAQIIINDQIDILIDLGGYTAYTRSEFLALKVAKVQAQTIGYPDTMGADFIDYILADKFIAPYELAPYYEEAIYHLPTSFIGPFYPPPEKELLKSSYGIDPNIFVFVGFNRPSKIQPELFECWLEILQEVPNSILLLSKFDEEPTQNLLNFAANFGADTDRIVFAPKRDYDDYLDSHRVFDLFLDTWHYSAGSTLIAAVGNGLPAITIVDDTNASRMGACIIAAAGLEELICDNMTEYKNLAVSLAKDPNKLQEYKKRLDNENALLFNYQKYAKSIEDFAIYALDKIQD